MVINIIHCSNMLIINPDNAFLTAIGDRHLNGGTLCSIIVYHANGLTIDRCPERLSAVIDAQLIGTTLRSIYNRTFACRDGIGNTVTISHLR